MSSTPSFLPHTHDSTPIHGCLLRSCPFSVHPPFASSVPIYSAPSLSSRIIRTTSSIIFLESFTLVNGFYRLASSHGFILATSEEFEFDLSFDSGWRIPVISDSPTSRLSPLYIPNYSAKASAITWWALQMELIVSTFIFQSSPVLLTTLMGWVGRDPFATRRDYYFALRHHSSYFSHLGRAFFPAADAIFSELCNLWCEGPGVFQLVPLDYISARHPTFPTSPFTASAQYLPVDAAMSRGGPFSYAQELPMAFRMARRSIFNIPVFKLILVPPQPLSRSLLSSLISLKCFLTRHINLVKYTLAFPSSFHQVYVPRLLHDPHLLRFFSCLVSSRNAHSPMDSRTLSPTTPPSRTLSCLVSSRKAHVALNSRTRSPAVLPSRTTPLGAYRQRTSRTSSHVVPIYPFPHPVSRLQYFTPGARPRNPYVSHACIPSTHGGRFLRLSRTLSCVVHLRSSSNTLPRSFHILPYPEFARALRFLAFLATLSSVYLAPYVMCLSTLHALPPLAILLLRIRYLCRNPLLVPLFNEYFSYHPP